MSEASGEARVLFATSNGTGLGHLNRAMAIARRLPADVEPVFFTLSEAAPVVAGAGFRVEYHPSYRRPASGSDWEWNMRLRRRLEALLEDERPDLVVFDGVHPYRALTHVLSAEGAPRSVWCRRPLWRAGSRSAPLRRTGAFDVVLEPGELAEGRDRGPTVKRRREVVAVDPIVYLDRDELLPRSTAAAELGLDPRRTTALVNLGQGGATDVAVQRVLSQLDAEPELQVAALESSIGSDLAVPERVVRLRATFPMSRYFAAFDLAVAAAGYNAFHELVEFGVPSLFVPMPRNTDDQAARARWADEEGVGLAVEGPSDPALPDRLERLLDPDLRGELRGALAELSERTANGAGEAAALLVELLDGAPADPDVRDRNRLRRWLRLSSHPIGPSLPLALALTARDRIYHPERGRPLGLVSALGLDEDDFEQEVSAAVDSFGLPRERVMVLTDSLQLGTLRRLGVSFRRLPGAAELGLEYDDPAYRKTLQRRFDLALAPWHGRWRVKRIGPGNEALSEAATAS